MLRKSKKHYDLLTDPLTTSTKEDFTVDYDTFLLRPKVIMDTHSFEYDKMMNMLNIVLKFIIENKLTIVGGMAINYSLIKTNKDKLYSDDEIPDYDIITDKPVEYAFALANILTKEFDFENIDIIRALHPSTVRVRYYLITLLDITYIAPDILSEIPKLQISPSLINKPTHEKYGDITFVHPWYQFMDIHYAMANPYENSPVETVNIRTYKDIHRYNKMYDQYPTIDKSDFNLYDIKFTEDIIKIIESDFLWNGFIAYEIFTGKINPDGPHINEIIKLPLPEIKILSIKNTNVKSDLVKSKLRLPKHHIFKIDDVSVSIELINKTTLYCKRYPKCVHIQNLLMYFITEHLTRKNPIEKKIFLHYYEKTRQLLDKSFIDIDGIIKQDQKHISDLSDPNVFPGNVNKFDTILEFDYSKFPWTD